MSTMITDELIKVRSCAGCISAAFDTYTENFKNIFKKTWTTVLTFSILSGISSFVSYALTKRTSTASSDVDTLLFNSSMTLISDVVFALLCLLIGQWAIAKIVTMINGENAGRNFSKLLKIVFTCIAISLIEILFSAGATVTLRNLFSIKSIAIVVLIVAFIMLIINILAILPLSFSFTKYLIEPKGNYKNVFGDNWKRGLHYWGFLFRMATVTILMSTIIIFMTSIHMIIIQIATNANLSGMLTGDADGLPPYFGYIMFLSQSIGSFIMMYFVFFFVLLYSFAYGSVKARHEKMIQMKNETV